MDSALWFVAGLALGGLADRLWVNRRIGRYTTKQLRQLRQWLSLELERRGQPR